MKMDFSFRMARAFVSSISVAIGLAATVLPVTAAPMAGPAGAAFYVPPSPLPSGNHGDLIWYRTATVNLGTGAPAVRAWNVLYRSTDASAPSVSIVVTPCCCSFIQSRGDAEVRNVEVFEGKKGARPVTDVAAEQSAGGRGERAHGRGRADLVRMA